MTKAPRAGQVKTRLTPPLTAEEAAALNICFLRDTAAAISGVGEGARGFGCYTPTGTEALYEGIFPGNFRLFAQRGTDLGERLTFAVQDLLALGFNSVCLIGSDSPTVAAATFAEAVKIMGGSTEKVVLGPSNDGGYYLIGLKALRPRLFEEISWSTGSVLEQTVERAGEIGLPVHFLPAAYDVDDHVTLGQLCHDLLGSNHDRNEILAPATRKFLQLIIAREGPERIWPGQVIP